MYYMSFHDCPPMDYLLFEMEVQQRTFPSVTLCNLSPYSLRGLESREELNALVGSLSTQFLNLTQLKCNYTYTLLFVCQVLAYDYAINTKLNELQQWNIDGVVATTS